jgi:hypothetical protein
MFLLMSSNQLDISICFETLALKKQHLGSGLICQGQWTQGDNSFHVSSFPCAWIQLFVLLPDVRVGTSGRFVIDLQFPKGKIL